MYISVLFVCTVFLLLLQSLFIAGNFLSFLIQTFRLLEKVGNTYCLGRQEGQDLSSILSSLSLLAFEGEFSGVVDNLVQENFSGDKPPDPQLIKVLPRDQTLFFWERA